MPLTRCVLSRVSGSFVIRAVEWLTGELRLSTSFCPCVVGRATLVSFSHRSYCSHRFVNHRAESIVRSVFCLPVALALRGSCNENAPEEFSSEDSLPQNNRWLQLHLHKSSQPAPILGCQQAFTTFNPSPSLRGETGVTQPAQTGQGEIYPFSCNGAQNWFLWSFGAECRGKHVTSLSAVREGEWWLSWGLPNDQSSSKTPQLSPSSVDNTPLWSLSRHLLWFWSCKTVLSTF